MAVGSTSKVPPIDGLADTHPWTNEQATLTRELPRSLLVLGGGPTGCELAQVFVRFGVPTTIVQSGPRLVPTDHPRNAETVRFALERDGAVVRTGARATRARAGAGTDGAHVIDLDDGTSAEGHAILLAVGREFPVRDLGMEAYGIEVPGPTPTSATVGCGSPMGCGSPATRRARSSTRTRATTRASSRSGWRWANRSSRTTAPSPGRRTWTPSRRRSG